MIHIKHMAEVSLNISITCKCTKIGTSPGEREQYCVLCHWAFTVSPCAVIFFQPDFPKGMLISHHCFFDDYSVYGMWEMKSLCISAFTKSERILSLFETITALFYCDSKVKQYLLNPQRYSMLRMDLMLSISYKPQRGLLTDSLHVSKKPRSNTICIRKAFMTYRDLYYSCCSKFTTTIIHG